MDVSSSKLSVSSAKMNKIMIGAGALIVVLMIVSSVSNGMQRRKIEMQCKNGDIDICTKLIESKILKPKELIMAHAFRGYHYDKKGQYDKALDDYNEAIKLNAEEPALYLQRAGVYADKSDLNNAIPDFNTTIKLSRSPGVLLAAYCGRGLAEMTKGDAASARNDLQEAKNIVRGNKVDCVTKLEQGLGQPPNTATP
ncbi:MAG TPA: tetratricopeptide repeat protein [Patescibacteria group bacterium]|nr:tetratricopeptide repeat protein [Patescibacteria group bacterium]